MENYIKVNGHKKKRLGSGGIVFAVGVVALVVTCAAIFIAMRIKRSRHSCSVRTTRGQNCVQKYVLLSWMHT
jgi:uncharacterized membrane protein YciS (DUF1049 family)